MAIIVPQSLEAAELEKISAFMHPEYNGELPDLSPRALAVLNMLTGPPVPLSGMVVGRLILHTETREGIFSITDEGKKAKHSDAIYDEDGNTGKRGVVIEDYETPEDAFLIGVPI